MSTEQLRQTKEDDSPFDQGKEFRDALAEIEELEKNTLAKTKKLEEKALAEIKGLYEEMKKKLNNCEQTQYAIKKFIEEKKELKNNFLQKLLDRKTFDFDAFFKEVETLELTIEEKKAELRGLELEIDVLRKKIHKFDSSTQSFLFQDNSNGSNNRLLS